MTLVLNVRDCECVEKWTLMGIISALANKCDSEKHKNMGLPPQKNGFPIKIIEHAKPWMI